MKSKIFLLIAIISCSLSVKAQSKVGTVDSEYIISKMPQLKLVDERIKNYGAKLDSINKIKLTTYETTVKNYNDSLKVLSDDAKKKKFTEIKTIEQDIAKFRQNGAKMMQLRRNELLRPLYKKISETISVVAKEKGYTQILTLTGNEFAYIDEKYDITKLVMEKLGIKVE